MSRSYNLAEEVNIVHVERDKLADSDSGAVERLQDGSVSGAEPAIDRRCVEQSLDFFVFKETRQLLLLFRRSDGHNRVGGDVVSFDQKLVEAAQRCQFSSDGGFRVVPLIEEGQVGSNGLRLRREKQLIDLQIDLCRDSRGRSSVVRGR
jgi:hypothetical protein